MNIVGGNITAVNPTVAKLLVENESAAFLFQIITKIRWQKLPELTLLANQCRCSLLGYSKQQVSASRESREAAGIHQAPQDWRILNSSWGRSPLARAEGNQSTHQHVNMADKMLMVESRVCLSGTGSSIFYKIQKKLKDSSIYSHFYIKKSPSLFWASGCDLSINSSVKWRTKTGQARCA